MKRNTKVLMISAILLGIALTQITFVAVGNERAGSTFVVIKRGDLAKAQLFESEESACGRSRGPFSPQSFCGDMLTLKASSMGFFRLPHSDTVKWLSMIGK